MIVVADTSPLLYLLLIGEVDILPALYGSVQIPEEVFSELSDAGAPDSVRSWILHTPTWLVQVPDPPITPMLEKFDLHRGEAALQLPLDLNADAMLVDDRAAVGAALELGLYPVGTLSILVESHRKQLRDGYVLLERLLDETNFYCSARLREDVRAQLASEERQP